MIDALIESGKIQETLECLANSHFSQPDLDRTLAIAARYGQNEIAHALLDMGANPNATALTQMPALFAAIEMEHVLVVQTLLARGADVNLQPGGDWTPLHHAVDIEGDAGHQCDRPPTVTLTKLLLDHGADPNLYDLSGRRPIDIARNYNHTQAVNLLDTEAIRK